MKNIGIVACSAEGAALCYRTIAQAAEPYLGEYNHPTVTLHSIAMSQWMPAFNAGDYRGVGELMLRSAKVVAEAGADFAICPDNSCHLSWAYFIDRSPIPWLHIGDVVAQEAQRKASKKAGLLGTRFTMTGPMYRDAFRRHSIDVLPPEPEDQQMIDEVIWSELVHGSFPETSRLRYNQVISRLKKKGCDSVILGCTEIPLLVRPDDCPLPTLDSTRLLAHAAAEYAIGVGKPSVLASRKVGGNL
ncbi:MAG: aspartate racemase [Acidobacteria bacterium]|nr:MAG: aspartate racemase [Acidobacteriota bacterium]